MNEWRWRCSCSRFLDSTMLTFASKRYWNIFCIICLRLLIVGIIDNNFDLSSRLLCKVISVFFDSFWFFRKSCPSVGCIFQILCWCISLIFSPRSGGLSFILLLLCLTSVRNNDAATIDWGIIISMNEIVQLCDVNFLIVTFVLLKSWYNSISISIFSQVLKIAFHSYCLSFSH